jgi:hypothetical protein
VHAHYISLSTTPPSTYHEPSAPNASDIGLKVVGAIVWQQLHMGYALLSALLIALKSFLASFDINGGWGNNDTYKDSSLSRSRNAGKDGSNMNGSDQGYGLKALTSKVSRKEGKDSSMLRSWSSHAGTNAAEEEVGRRKVEKTGYAANVEALKEERDDGSVGSGRSGISQHPIIRYEQRYEVTSETRSDSVGGQRL